MARPKKGSADGEAEAKTIEVIEIDRAQATFRILGTSPLIFNRMAEKAKRELLLPRGRLNAADRASNLKHDPLAEYRASVHRHARDNQPTRLFMPSTAIKGTILTASLDLPGLFRTQIGRLTWVSGQHINIWGIPCLYMSTVRMADKNRTPDIRTRAMLEAWAAEVTLVFSVPLVKNEQVARLITAGGMMSGLGDYRQEKGKGSYGQFMPVPEDDSEWRSIVKHGGRAAQDAALEKPGFADAESEELYAWYQGEVARRTKAPTTTVKRRGRPPKKKDGNGLPAAFGAE